MQRPWSGQGWSSRPGHTCSALSTAPWEDLEAERFRAAEFSYQSIDALLRVPDTSTTPGSGANGTCIGLTTTAGPSAALLKPARVAVARVAVVVPRPVMPRCGVRPA